LIYFHHYIEDELEFILYAKSSFIISIVSNIPGVSLNSYKFMIYLHIEAIKRISLSLSLIHKTYKNIIIKIVLETELIIAAKKNFMGYEMKQAS